MSPSTKILVLAAGMTLPLLAAGCGSDGEPGETPVGVEPTSSSDPLAAIPRESLYGASPEENLWTPRYELEVLDLPEGWDGARFAILSDLLLGKWEGNEEVARAAVETAVAANPDVVLLVGDYMAVGTDAAPVARVLEPLRGRTSVAVLGDRDLRSDSIEAQITSVLSGLGVHVLRNNSIALERGGDTVFIAGLDPELLAGPPADQEYVLSTVGPDGRTPILLTHAPTLATRAPTDRYPVVIAGNTFCGEIEVAGSPRISWLRSEAFPNAAIEGNERLFRVRGSTVLVTCGIGYGFVPLRFGAAPEVPLLTIFNWSDGEEESVAESPADSLLMQSDESPADTAAQ